MIYKTITSYTIEPLKRYVKQYVEFLKEHPEILVFWIVIWVFNLNFATIVIAFWGYYFYFAVSFDLASIYMQVVKMFIDLQVVVKFVPIWLTTDATKGYKKWKVDISSIE